MAKRHRGNHIAASFHYLVKSVPNEADPMTPNEMPFSQVEFERLLDKVSNEEPLNDLDPKVIEKIKSGEEMPFSDYQEVEAGLYFGAFDGAYYGQKYRNNQLGEIPADSLNLRKFNYLLTRLRNGRVLIGVTYTGQFGDYDGLKRCFQHVLRGNYAVASKSVTNVADEIGDGTPIELRLMYRNASKRPERRGIFGQTGALSIKQTDFGDGFKEHVVDLAERMRGKPEERKRIIADIVKEGQLIELDDEDIVGCSAVIRQNKRTTTVYFLGGNFFATKFRLDVSVNADGIPDQEQVKNEMISVMRERVIPLLVE